MPKLIVSRGWSNLCNCVHWGVMPVICCQGGGGIEICSSAGGVHLFNGTTHIAELEGSVSHINVFGLDY